MGVQVQEGGGRREGDVRAVREAQEAERAGLGRLQLAVTEFEGGLDREVAGLEFVQPAAFVGQLGGQYRDRPGAAGGQAGSGDTDGQGEETAGGHHVQGGVAFGVHPLLADDAGEELEGLLRGHHVQVDQVRAHQVDHAHPAGDEGHAARRAGEQRADLGGVVRVVQQDQDPAAVQGGAVEGGPLGQGVRDRGVRGAEGAQERAEDGLRFGGARARALEIDVELAVREVRAGPVGDVHGERRLADTPDTGQRRDGHHGALGGGQPVAQLTDEGTATGEVLHRRRELCGADRSRGRGGLVGRTGQFLVGPEDALLEAGQPGVRIDPQLLGEEPPGVRVHGERLGLPATAVQGDHQELAEAFAQGVGGGERGQFGDGLRVVAHLQVQVQAGLDELEAPFLQAGALVVGVGPGDGGQHLAVPQAEELDDQRARPVPVPAGAGLLGLGRQVLGGGEVEGRAVEAERVAARLADQRLLPEGLAEPGGVRAYGRQGLGGRGVAPEGVDELRRGGGTAVPEQQGGEQRALLR
ncbi:hypothetical protein GCM10010327_51470 [Streptomyces nitrosporeus]|nr:hypothetical protein GCM10010327_51470 [Streptomyces nitrosporeus]